MPVDGGILARREKAHMKGARHRRPSAISRAELATPARPGERYATNAPTKQQGERAWHLRGFARLSSVTYGAGTGERGAGLVPRPCPLGNCEGWRLRGRSSEERCCDPP